MCIGGRKRRRVISTDSHKEEFFNLLFPCFLAAYKMNKSKTKKKHPSVGKLPMQMQIRGDFLLEKEI